MPSEVAITPYEILRPAVAGCIEPCMCDFPTVWLLDGDIGKPVGLSLALSIANYVQDVAFVCYTYMPTSLEMVVTAPSWLKPYKCW